MLSAVLCTVCVCGKGSKSKTKKENDLFKLVFAVVMAALRKKDRSAEMKKIPKSCVKQVVKKLKEHFTVKGQFVITKQQFKNDMHTALQKIHEKMKDASTW